MTSLLPCIPCWATEAQMPNTKGKPITFGIISDIHQELQKNAGDRLKTFIDEALKHQSDFIIQLGDLHHGKDVDPILHIWNSFSHKKFHVLGNHEMDRVSKNEIIKKQEMPGAYYSFDIGDYHFIVLDTNYFYKNGEIVSLGEGNSAQGEKQNSLSPAQLEWLKNDLKQTKKPTLLFSHAGFDEVPQGYTSPSRKEVRNIIREANAETPKVIACFCGHHHIDQHSEIDGVHYFQINSASYHWIGGKNKFSNGNMAEYKDPLYAFVTLDPVKKTITIKGKETEYLPPAPTLKTYKHTEIATPHIKSRTLETLN